MSLFGMAAMKIDPSSVAAQQAAVQQRETRPDLLEMQQYCSQLAAGNYPPNYNPDPHPGYQHATSNPHAQPDSGSGSDYGEGSLGDYTSSDSSSDDDEYYSDSDDPQFMSKEAYDQMQWDVYKDGPHPITPDIPIGSQRPHVIYGHGKYDPNWGEAPWEDERVFTGYWTDPNTGAMYKMYQDPLPSPNVADGGYTEDDLKKTHPKLIQLSGNIDPNRKDVPKKEHMPSLPGIADGPSFAGQQLLSTGDRNEARYRVARDIFMYRHGETPGDRAPEMDKYPNGYIGYQQMFRPIPQPGVTFRGGETRWVIGPDPQNPSGKQRQMVQGKVHLNQNPARQVPGRIAPISLRAERQSKTSRCEDRNPENNNRGKDDERYHVLQNPGGNRHVRVGQQLVGQTQRGVLPEDPRTGALQQPGGSRKAPFKGDSRMTQKESLAVPTRTAPTQGADAVHLGRAPFKGDSRMTQKESMAVPARTAATQGADQVHLGRAPFKGDSRMTQKESMAVPVRTAATQGADSVHLGRAPFKGDSRMTQKESMAVPTRTAPTQGADVVSLGRAPFKGDSRMTQKESLAVPAGREQLDLASRTGFGERANYADLDRQNRRNDCDTSKYTYIGPGALPSQGLVYTGADRCKLPRYQPQNGENVGRSTYKSHIAAHTRIGKSDIPFRRRHVKRGTRARTFLGHQTGINYDAQSDIVASDVDVDCQW